jgi:hypothetical protein
MAPCTNEHVKWFVDTGERLKTADGKDVAVWEFRHEADAVVLSAWSKHFRNHYCLDANIDFMRGKRSRKDYLNEIKFPSKTTKLGPAVRAGDFGEILVADYLHWVLDFWVPRVRWGSKVVRDESPKGSDVIGFKFFKKSGTSSKDVLAVFESKAKFSKGSGESRLQDAINDSAKDHIRIDESLNYIKQKLFECKEFEQSKLIERFQSPVDLPYQESYGAAAIITEEHFEADEVTSADTRKIPKSKKSKEVIPHPNRDHLVLLLIKGTDMMTLVHELYRRAADEA